MKSFNVFVDKRSVQSDLIVVNLPVRNDIAAYSWLTINSELINHIISEKAVSPNLNGIAFDAKTNVATEKYEVVDGSIAVDADAEFKVLFPLSIDEGKIELKQLLQEVSQKIERVSLPVPFGVDDEVEFFPLKTIGSADIAVEFGAALSETKNSIIVGDGVRNGVVTDAILYNPFAVYYERATDELYLGASVQSLSYLLNMRLVQNGIIVGVDTVDFDLYRSLGKLSAKIAVGADASFAIQFFIDGENEIKLFSEAGVFPYKFITPESGITLGSAGTAILRRLRPLSEIDALGALADIDNMTLDEMYYAIVLE